MPKKNQQPKPVDPFANDPLVQSARNKATAQPDPFANDPLVQSTRKKQQAATAPTVTPTQTRLPAVPKDYKLSDSANPASIENLTKGGINRVWSATKAAIDTISTPVYFLEGDIAATNKIARTQEKMREDLLVKAKAGKWSREKIVKELGALQSTDAYRKPKGLPVGVEGGLENALSWTQGKPTLYGSDLIKTAYPEYDPEKAGFIPGLVVDMVLDPLTHGLGRVATTAIKAADTGVKQTIKGARLAAQGKISTQIAARLAPEATKETILKTGQAIKPGRSVLQQVTTKPVIKENLKRTSGPMAERLAKTDNLLATKFLYQTTESTTDALKVLGSALEAGFKGAASRILLENAKYDLTKIARAERRAAKKAGSITVTAAPKAVMENGALAPIEEMVPHITPEGTFVYDGKYLHSFANEAEANAWVNKTNELPSETPVQPTRGQAPVVDTAPQVTIPAVAKELPAGTSVAKESKALLSKIEKLAKTAKGTTVGANVTQKVKAIINRADGGINLDSVTRQTLGHVVKSGADPFAIITRFAARTSSAMEKTVARILFERPITMSNGKETNILSLMSLVEKSGKTWANLNDFLQKQVVDHVAGLLQTTKQSTKTKLQELAELVGDEVAGQIARTGALEPTGKVDKARLQEILDNIPQGVEKTYASAEELFKGLKAGDQGIDLKILEKLVKAIDPENVQILQAAKAADEDKAYNMLKALLVKKGPDTIFEVQRRLELLDAQMLMEADGIELADTLALYTEDRLAGRTQPMMSAMTEAREAAMMRVYQWSQNPETNKFLNEAYISLNEGFSGNFEYIQTQILDSPDMFEGATTLMDLAARSTNAAYQAETKAALLGKVTQSLEARIMSNMFGRIRYREGVRGLGKKPTRRDVDPNVIMDQVLIEGPMVEDALLATTNARITYQRVAKTSKGEKHYIFASIPEIARIFNETGGRATFIKGLIPDTRQLGIKKTDAFAFISVGNAVRHVLETVGRKGTVDVAEVVNILKKKGEQETPWSKEFKAQADEAATQFAEHLAKPEVIEAFQKLHTERAIATIEDNMSAVNSMTTDLFETYFQGWRANMGRGFDSTEARAAAAREWFNKFVYTSGIFKAQNGEVAEVMFRAAAMMFIREGRLRKLVEGEGTTPSLIGSPRARAEEDRLLYEAAINEIRSFFKKQASDNSPNIHPNKKPFPTKAEKAAATDKLTEAKLAYEEHIGKRAAINTKKQGETWAKRFTTLQNKLDEARSNAQQLGIQTHHWDGDQWVPSEKFDHAAAVERAKNADESFIRTDEGTLKAEVVDTVNKFPTHKRLTAANTKKLMDAWYKQNSETAMNLMEGKHEETAQLILNRRGEFENLPIDEAAQGERMWFETIAKTYSDAEIKIIIPKQGLISRAGRAGDTGVTEAAASERVSATARKWNLRPLLNKAETNLMNDVVNAVDYAHALRNKYRPYGRYNPLALVKGEKELGLNNDEFLEAFQIATTRAPLESATSAKVGQLAHELRLMLDPVFGTKETGELVAAGISPKALQAAFRKFGLEGNGLPDIGLWEPNQLSEILESLPFGKIPDWAKGTPEEAIFLKRAEEFAASGIDPFIILTRIIQAVQFAKSERTFVLDFASRFSAKAMGLTPQQALDMGWVKIEGIGPGGTNLAEHLPTPEQGGLFPPDIAEEFFALNREWNALFNDRKALSKAVTNMMWFVGTLKASQTILRVGHHVTNIVGDFTAAYIAGMRNPFHIAQGIKMAAGYAGEDILAALSKNKVDRKLQRFLKGIDNKDQPIQMANKEGVLVPYVVINQNGKNVKVPLDMEQLRQRFQERNIIIGNIMQNDIQGMYDSVLATDNLLGARKELAAYVGAKIRQGVAAIERPAGSIASYYGNAIRAGHALSVIQSRSWKSLEEALDAANDTINRYHPTIQSLAAGERVTPRIMFTYYTWLRVAHNALIDMAVNHTSAMMVPFKAQVNIAQANGLEPSSIGNPWENTDKTPNYLDYSVYGPTRYNEQGDLLRNKLSVLPMDVLDTYNFSWDPSYSEDKNIYTQIQSLARIPAAASNIAVQPLFELGFKVEPQTGRPTQIESVSDMVKSLLSKMGQANLIKSQGGEWLLPEGKQLTDEDKARLQLNWLTGAKESVVNSRSNVVNMRQEERDALIARLTKNAQKDK